ncbi:MAG: hypothetical protein HQL53_05260, partial [Magnetococcales bacterium]|nr:hypothetical protein [Magnetococcales bacterium]
RPALLRKIAGGKSFFIITLGLFEQPSKAVEVWKRYRAQNSGRALLFEATLRDGVILKTHEVKLSQEAP